MAQKIKFKDTECRLSLQVKFQILIAMNKNKIINRLEDGYPATVRSMPFSVLLLREMAKAALRGNTMLTIIAEENLSDTDIDNIISEAPAKVHIDYSRCKF